VDVAAARHGARFSGQQAATFGVRDDVLNHRNRRSLADARTAIYALIAARFEGDLLDGAMDEFRHQNASAVARRPGFLFSNLDSFFDGCRIVRDDLGADAIFERRDDLAARRVIFGVGRKDEQHIERQAYGITLNLYVAFLHDVEQTDLHFAGEVWQFVDGEDAAIGARQQAVMNRQFVREQMPAARRFDGIEVADQIGDGHVGRRQLFDVAIATRHKGDGRLVAALVDQQATSL